MNLVQDHIHSFTCDLVFSNKATFDDILQGEVNVTLRNDFNIPHMSLFGRIASIKVLSYHRLYKTKHVGFLKRICTNNTQQRISTPLQTNICSF